ncbi:MAG TPA: hypothetical protein VMK12_09140, partial [Anaeromyxobacteraceae bacterium]|nr:hypothetical protein [Anaeromyxobacteraceae bacterium]
MPMLKRMRLTSKIMGVSMVVGAMLLLLLVFTLNFLERFSVSTQVTADAHTLAVTFSAAIALIGATALALGALVSAQVGGAFATLKAQLDRLSKGVIPSKYAETGSEDLDAVRESLNRCIDAMNALVADTAMLAASATEGKFATRADASRHQGCYRNVVAGMNGTLDAVLRAVPQFLWHGDPQVVK